MEKQTPESEVLFELADLFKVFGDSTRLRIMYALSQGLPSFVREESGNPLQ